MLAYFEALTEELMERFRTFSVMEIGIFKTCLILFGILVGMYSANCCKKCKAVIWVSFIASYFYVMYRIFVSPYHCCICDCGCCDDWDIEEDEDEGDCLSF